MVYSIAALFYFKALSFGEGLGGVGVIAALVEVIAALVKSKEPMVYSIAALFFFKALSFGEGLGGVGVIA